MVCVLFVSLSASGQEDEKLIVGPNVNMVSGTEFPGGDPFLQRQNEPTGAVSSRNGLHLLAGANDYRAVDIPFEVTGPSAAESGGDSWLGVFTSIDGGSRWKSTLLPGYPQDLSCGPETPPETRPALCGYQAGADAVVRAGTHGLFYYSGIVFDRGEGAPSAVFVSRFMDLNNDEGGDPIRHIDTVIVDSNLGTEFLDKPWIAVDVPRAGASSALFQVPQGEGAVSQTVSCGRVYLAYAKISGSPSEGDLRSQILLRSSGDCGTSWSPAVQLSADDTLNQGASVAVSPTTGDVFVVWRQFSSVQSFLGEGSACPQPAGFWKTAEWPVETLMMGGVLYTKAQALALLKSNAKGDATRILVHQLIPAKLNALSGTDEELQDQIELADAWLVANPVGSNPQGAARVEGLSIKDGLQTFNEADPALCGSTTTATTVLLDDAILVAKSTNGGASFSEPAVVSIATPFDQGSTQFSFRSTAYPSIAVDAEEAPRTYVVWSQRGLVDPEVESRIALSTSLDGSTWTEPVPVDPPDAPGHQIKPSLLFTGGKLVLAYYDFRQDVSNIFEQFVADLPLADRLRHSVDVRVAIADPGASPEFTDYSILEPSTEPSKPSQQVSRYPFVIVGSGESDAETIQLQYMTPNVPLFAGGTRPFIGDFIDVLGQFFVSNPEDGTWRFATEPGEAGVYHAVWADNRDVVPPNDGDWTSYVPPLFEGRTAADDSVFNPGEDHDVPICNDETLDRERTGMRNQNIYTAVMTGGLLVAAPGNTKLLGFSEGEGLVQATFVVVVQNVTAQDRRFRLTAVQPADGDASFEQLMLQTAIDVTVPAYSSASRTLYLRSPDPTASALVLVTEIDFGGNPIDGGLTGSVRLNPDPTSPAPDLSAGEVHTPAILNPAIFNPAILNPAIFNPAILNPAILNPAIFNPAIFNPAILNPAIFNPAIFNPAILNPAIFNPAIFNPAIFNPAILNPAILNPAILNPAILNPAILNPAIFNPAILNPAILNPAILNTALDETSRAADYTFAVRNDGTTTTAYDLNFNVGAQSEGLIYQLFVFRLNTTPVADGCELAEEAQQELLVNLLNPEVNAERLLDPAEANPSTATFSIGPGGVVFVTLRVLPDLQAPTPGNPLDFNDGNVSVAVVAQPLDSADLASGDTQPTYDSIVASSIAPLVIDPIVLPTGEVGVIYPDQTLTASGGSGTQVWSVVGALPPGLALSGGGVLSGTPTSAGSFNLIVRVTDAAQIAQLPLSVAVNNSGSPGSFAYVGNGGGATTAYSVSVIDLGTDSVVTEIPVASYPSEFAVTPDGRTVYVAGSNLIIIDATTNQVVTSVSIGGPPGDLVITPDGSTLYISTGNTPGFVRVFDTATQTVTQTIPVDDLPTVMAISSFGTRLFVAHHFGTLSVIDTATNTVVATATGVVNAKNLVISPDGTRGYMTHPSPSGAVYVFNTTTLAAVTSIPVGGSPYGLALTPDGQKAYVPNLSIPAGYVSVIDTSTNTLWGNIPLGDAPLMAAMNPNGSHVYITNNNSNYVTVIDTATNTVVGPVTVGTAPAEIAVKPFETFTFVVTTVADGGPGSLRQAVLDANTNPGPDYIEFNIPGSGPHTISPTSSLPPLTNPVVLDATTQPGFSGTPVVELEGSGAGAGVGGLVITAGSSTVRGLAINRFSTFGIHVMGSGNTVIEGNYVGTDLSGSVDQGNGSVGVFVTDSQNNTVGGFFATTGNLISGNGGHGVAISGPTATGNVVRGNRIGTDVSGSVSIPNNGGVRLLSPNNTIGGSIPAARNVISGNNGFGIFLQTGSDNTVVQGNFVGVDALGTSPLGNATRGVQSETNGNTIGGMSSFESNIFSSNGQFGVWLAAGTNNLIQGNFIGTDLSGTLNLGNTGHGVEVSGSASDNSIGGTAPNHILHNGLDGIHVGSGVRNAVFANVIHSNSALGIDIDALGINPNDPGDTDAGANNLQNFPVLTSATTGALLTIDGTLSSTPDTLFDIWFYTNTACDPLGYGEGETRIGTFQVLTGPSGDGSISAQFPSVAAGLFLTAVAVDPSNNTSEFSACLLITP
jgi:YVTN family beta-propeller protein